MVLGWLKRPREPRPGVCFFLSKRVAGTGGVGHLVGSSPTVLTRGLLLHHHPQLPPGGCIRRDHGVCAWNISTNRIAAIYFTNYVALCSHDRALEPRSYTPRAVFRVRLVVLCTVQRRTSRNGGHMVRRTCQTRTVHLHVYGSTYMHPRKAAVIRC